MSHSPPDAEEPGARAAREFLPLVYGELRKLAAAKLASERIDHTLNATALVHEAFLKLGGDRAFASRTDYLRAAAQAMRRILVDHARARKAEKRAGGKRVELESHLEAELPPSDDFETLDEILKRLAIQFPRHAELVELRVFGGLNLEECAVALGIAPRTADSWWAYARAWISLELKKS